MKNIKNVNTVKSIIKAFAIIEALDEAGPLSIDLGIVRDNKIVYVDKKEGKSPIKVSIKIGTSIPMHCTGMGKAVLSHMNETERENIINQIEYRKYAKNTSLDKGTLLRRLDKSHELGYSIDDEEYI